MNRNRLFWGLSVMLLGSLLLLNSLGFIHMNVWKFVGPGVLILLGVWFIINSVFQKTPDAPESLSISREGETELDLDISHGAGQLRISADQSSTTLLQGTFLNGVESKVDRQGPVTKVNLKPFADPVNIIIPGNFHGLNWDVKLNPDLPISIKLSDGASDTFLNLSQVNLKSLDISTGASKTEVTFSEKSLFTRAKIGAGVAEVIVNVPTQVAASIVVNGKELSSIKVDTTRFIQQGDRYESAEYATAEKKLDLEINPGLGEVNIR
jgi:hypothetical protein